jgi:hypothetical protein
VSIDDFLLDAAITLGTTQKQIETEFYMLDIFKAVERKNRQNARERILDLQITNSRHMEKEAYVEFVQSLNRAAEFEDKVQKFDRNAMDALHAFTHKNG